MEHAIAFYLRQVWDEKNWLYVGQHAIRPGYSRESQAITVCQDIADSLDTGVRVDAIVVNSKAFDVVRHGCSLEKIANSRTDHRMVIWIKEFLLGRTQRVRIGEVASDEARVTSGVPEGSVLGPLLFLAYINDVGKTQTQISGSLSTIALFTEK